MGKKMLELCNKYVKSMSSFSAHPIKTFLQYDTDIDQTIPRFLHCINLKQAIKSAG